MAKHEFTNSEIAGIQSRRANGESRASVAKALNVHPSVIKRVEETEVRANGSTVTKTGAGRGPGRPPKLTEAQGSFAEQLYGEGLGSVEIAERLTSRFSTLDKCTPTTVLSTLRRRGVEIRPVGRPKTLAETTDAAE